MAEHCRDITIADKFPNETICPIRNFHSLLKTLTLAFLPSSIASDIFSYEPPKAAVGAEPGVRHQSSRPANAPLGEPWTYARAEARAVHVLLRTRDALPPARKGQVNAPAAKLRSSSAHKLVRA